jgi:hypothetical protein
MDSSSRPQISTVRATEILDELQKYNAAFDEGADPYSGIG